MGAATSRGDGHPEQPCALLQMRTWKNEKMETLIVAPLNEELFQGSPAHPLFRLLHAARNQPAVRHWHVPSQECSNVNRSSQLEPEVEEERYYKEVFGSLEQQQEKQHEAGSRWMLLAMPIAGAPKGTSLAIEELYILAESTPTLYAAGFFEHRHLATQPCSTLRYWMVKSFNTEGRSLVLFQAAAFMEVRRLQQAKVQDAKTSPVEFSIRVGDTSALRSLEWIFRKLLPQANAPCHPHVSIQPVAGSSRVLTVRVGSPALDVIMVALHKGVKASGHVGGTPILTIDSRSVEQFETPFAANVDAAKEIWSRENSVVVKEQPNQRHQERKRGRRTKEVISSGSGSSSGGSETPSPLMYPNPQGSPNSNEILATSSNKPSAQVPGFDCTASSSSLRNSPEMRSSVKSIPPIVAGGNLTHRSNADSGGPTLVSVDDAIVAAWRTVTPYAESSQGSSNATPPVSNPPTPVSKSQALRTHQPYNLQRPPLASNRTSGTSSTISQPVQVHYRLHDNTPVHYSDPHTGKWIPFFYVDQGARLQLPTIQEYQGQAKLTLETPDHLVLVDSSGGRSTFVSPPFPMKNRIVVHFGCPAIQCEVSDDEAVNVPVQLHPLI